MRTRCDSPSTPDQHPQPWTRIRTIRVPLHQKRPVGRDGQAIGEAGPTAAASSQLAVERLGNWSKEFCDELRPKSQFEHCPNNSRLRLEASATELATELATDIATPLNKHI